MSGPNRSNRLPKRTPYSFETHFDRVASAKIKNTREKGHHISFAEAEAVAGAVVYYDDVHTEGLRVGIGYTATYVGFEDNPKFDQEHFEMLNINIGGFTKRLDDWFWRAQLSINIDTREWDAPYTNYDLVLWGRYTFCKDIGFHMGFWAQTGMWMDRVYPIFGADWQIDSKWKLNLVYPVNVSLQYALTKKWALAIAGRSFDFRDRVSKKESRYKDLVHYENIGCEFMVLYIPQT